MAMEKCDQADRKTKVKIETDRQRDRTRTRKLYFTRTVVWVKSKT